MDIFLAFLSADFPQESRYPASDSTTKDSYAILAARSQKKSSSMEGFFVLSGVWTPVSEGI
jgi:protein gp37